MWLWTWMANHASVDNPLATDSLFLMDARKHLGMKIEQNQVLSPSLHRRIFLKAYQ